MRPHILSSVFVSISILATARAAAQAAPPPSGDWNAVEQALGRKGAPNPRGVIKFSFPRTDMSVSVAGVQIRPALALGSWVAFEHTSDGALMMGDLVLAEQEVAPVMKKLESEDVEPTALHNHLMMESPRVMYMHVHGHGDAAKLAAVIRDALALTKTPMDAAPATPASAIDLDTAMIAKTLGVTGKVNGGVYQESVPRADHITEHGIEVPPSMGVATAINFQPTGGGRAATTGDFVMIASEVAPVIRALTSHGLSVGALHSHMLEETPRLFFMHFWANDDASALAGGLRAALDAMNVKRATQP
jgi:Domain of Unknown Function (DUF1259)